MLLIAENIIQIIFLILSLSVNSSPEGARTLASFKHTPHQKHGMSQSVTNAGESQWAFDYSAVKPVVWSGNIWIRQSARALLFTVAGLAARDEDSRIKAWIWVCSSQSYGFWRSGLQRINKIVSFRNYVAVLVCYIVLLSVTACPRKRFLWPMANKVNITWQVKVKRLQKCYLFWGFKVKSCLTLCRHILGNELAEITQNRTKCYHFILGKLVNNWKQGNWYDN